MKDQILENYYLCGIGQGEEIQKFEVGSYDEDRQSFSFHNGSYSPSVLYKEPRGGNATHVISAISLQYLDDNELLISAVVVQLEDKERYETHDGDEGDVVNIE